MIRPPSDLDLLHLWEIGSLRHPIDRALLLYAWMHPEQPPASLPDLPLGQIHLALVQLRRAIFGNRIEGYADCEACGVRLDLPLDAGQLLQAGQPATAEASVVVAGQRFRAPTSRDLAALNAVHDPPGAATLLMERCRIGSPDREAAAGDAIPAAAPPIEAVSAALEELDPAADLALTVDCGACGHQGELHLDVLSLLWEELGSRVRSLLLEVHRLARAYGWREAEILGLSRQRRAAYLSLVGP